MTDDLGFHPERVVPFYLELMNWNFLRLSDAEKQEFAQHIQRVLKTLDNQDIKHLLDSENWRARLVAGWFAGFDKRKELSKHIGENLIAYPSYAYMYCFTLARINNETAIDYLSAYLEKYLSQDYATNMTSETLSVQYVLAALFHIAPDRAGRFYPEKWNAFVNTHANLFADWSSELRNHWHLDRAKNNFNRWLNFAEKHFD